MISRDASLIEVLLKNLDPSNIYSQAYTLADEFAFLSGILLLLSIIFRTVNEQATVLTTGNSRWGQFFFDVFMWSFVLVVYSSLAYLMIQFFEMLYRWGDVNGGIKMMTLEMDRVIQSYNTAFSELSLKDKAAGLAPSILSPLMGLGIVFILLALKLFYILTFLAVIFVSSLLNLGHAFAFCIAYIWGTIAIPLSITAKFDWFKKWIQFVLVIMLFPFITSLIIFLFRDIFIATANDIISTADIASPSTRSFFYAILSILNMIIIAVLVSAPFITQGLIKGSDFVGGLVMPFVAAGMGAASVTTAAAMNSSGILAKGGSAFLRTRNNSLKNSSFLNRLDGISQQIQNQNTFKGDSSSPESSSASFSDNVQNNSAPPTNKPQNIADEINNDSNISKSKSDNARRGYFVNKAMKGDA